MPLRTLAPLFKEFPSRKYTKGQIILYAGDRLSHVFFVKQGYIKMYSINEQGDERILMIFPPNSAFPILPSAIANNPYTLRYFYQAMTSIEVSKLTREEFSTLIDANKDAAQLILEYVTQLAGELVRRLGIIENKDAKYKIGSVLTYITKVCSTEIGPQKFRVNFKMTHQDIACLAGLARETTSAQIKQLENEKVLDQRRDGRLIIDAALLPE